MTTKTQIQIGARFEVTQSMPQAMRYKKEFAEMQVGESRMLPVAICRSRRILYDPVAYVVELECTKVLDGQVIRVSVKTKRCPSGCFPGVYFGAGMPILSSDDMEPRPIQSSLRRSFRRNRRYY